MAATARVTILMDRDQKERLAGLARKSDMSVGEFVRRKALGTDDEMASLLTLVRQSTAQANAALDRALAVIEQRDAGAETRRQTIIAATRREFTAADAAALSDWLGFAGQAGAA